MKLSIATWNLGTLNKNPFEHWLTIKDNPEYESIMTKIEKFIETPGELDVPVSEVFTQEMFEKLDNRITTEAEWESMESFWNDDYKNRKIVSGFLKDKILYRKEFVRIPDRMTGTIEVTDNDFGYECRPAVVNRYEGDLSTTEEWYKKWERFMFDHIVAMGGKEIKRPYMILKKVKKSKHPDITEAEEKLTLPLQILCLAIYDAILVHMMNTVSTPEVWQPLKESIVGALSTEKDSNALAVLEQDHYLTNDIITIQEVPNSFLMKIIGCLSRSPVGDKFHLHYAYDKKKVNSAMLLSKERFPSFVKKHEWLMKKVVDSFPEGLSIPDGDLNIVSTVDRDAVPYIIASLKADPNGLKTIRYIDAIVAFQASSPELVDHKLIIGVDANTYEKGEADKMLDVLEFGKSYVKHDLTSCFGDVPSPKNYTSYIARTYLQSELDKACKSSNKVGDVNPTDFILFRKKDFAVEKTWKDNTGNKDMEYVEDMAFTTFAFPSNHAIVSTVLESK